MKERIFTAHELKVWNEHFSSVNKAVLNANDLAAFNNQSVVIRVIEDLGYRFSPNAANWHLRVSA